MNEKIFKLLGVIKLFNFLLFLYKAKKEFKSSNKIPYYQKKEELFNKYSSKSIFLFNKGKISQKIFD